MLFSESARYSPFFRKLVIPYKKAVKSPRASAPGGCAPLISAVNLLFSAASSTRSVRRNTLRISLSLLQRHRLFGAANLDLRL